jgi:hypothetical protein
VANDIFYFKENRRKLLEHKIAPSTHKIAPAAHKIAPAAHKITHASFICSQVADQLDELHECVFGSF